MHILLTDILTCPRCGPRFGLIVLADRIVDRRVMEGRLGCANCRSEYPVSGGVADLRTRAGGGAPLALALAGVEGERPLRLAALSGMGERQGAVMLRGVAPEVVAAVAELLPNANVFGAATAPPPGGIPEGVAWLLDDGSAPVRDRSLAAAAVVGPAGDSALGAMARVVVPGGHLVLDGGGSGAPRALESEGWSILLEQDGTTVASCTRAG